MASRFALSEHEKGILAITYIADGQWTGLGVTREEGASFSFISLSLYCEKMILKRLLKKFISQCKIS